MIRLLPAPLVEMEVPRGICAAPGDDSRTKATNQMAVRVSPELEDFIPSELRTVRLREGPSKAALPTEQRPRCLTRWRP